MSTTYQPHDVVKKSSSKDNITYEQVLINPTTAAAYLQYNVSNRNLKEKIVARYATDMENNYWHENTGETIKFDVNGNLIDGQHRLHAIIKSGASIKMTVVRNLVPDVFKVIDSGSKRSPGDIFHINGIKNAAMVTSIITQYLVVAKGNGYKGDGVSNEALLEEYNIDPLFWDTVATKTMSWYNSFAKIVNPSMIGSLYVLFHEKHKSKAELFFNQLCTGEDITNSTMYLIRNKLIADKTSSKRFPPTVKAALIIKAWNAFRKDKGISHLKYDPSKEEFPIPQ